MEAAAGAEAPLAGFRGVRVQAPFVDSVSCYCRVDTGLKTVTGAKRFVPGAKLCIQPDIKPSRAKARGSRKDRSRNHSPLLPGLPDDLAISCLIRVPRAGHQNLQLVCRRWNRLLCGNYYYSLRKKLGTAEEWIYVIKRDRDGKISWHAFDPIHQLWQPLPPIPGDYCEALGFGCAVLSGCYLYLFGGKDPFKGSMRCVIFFNARTNKWHRSPDMLRKRHFFGCCVMNNCIYVAGGECEGVHRSLRSAEVYDPNRGRWAFIADMSTPMVPFIGVVHEEKWFLKGLDSHRHVSSEVYSPASNNWSLASDGFVTGWRNPSISFGGRLYAADCRDGCRLKVYDGATDSWKKAGGSGSTGVHLGSSRATEAAALVPANRRLCIVRNNMSISLLDVLDQGRSLDVSSSLFWETVGSRGQLKNFMTHLWSSIAGRNGLKSHIVHCQVLQV